MAESFIDLNLHGDSKENNILIDSLELFFQEIELSVKLAPNDIWGIYEAINLQRYVFNKFVSITQIKNEINTYIKRNCQHANDFNYNVTAETIKGDNGMITNYCFTEKNDNSTEFSIENCFHSAFLILH